MHGSIMATSLRLGGACRIARRAVHTCQQAAEIALSIPPARVRNFCIISHVDHGKSTLADRLMELDLTGLVSPGMGGRGQLLDSLDVERARGITVKAQTVSLFYTPDGSDEACALATQ